MTEPTAEEYSDFLRDLFFRYGVGGYNDDGGLLSMDRVKYKMEALIEEELKSLARIIVIQGKEV